MRHRLRAAPVDVDEIFLGFDCHINGILPIGVKERNISG